MAFPDWPLSNGSLNPTGWTHNFMMLLEHGHRLSAGLVATLVTVLFFVVLRNRDRLPTAAFKLALWALVGVILQAILGGLRVKLNPLGLGVATTFRVFHGCVAQMELCLLVALAAVLSPIWRQLVPKPSFQKVARLGWLTAGFIFLQLIVGATMRHLGAGLAIPTFPLTPEGSFMPRVHNAYIDLNFTHTRLVAFLVVVHVLLLVRRAVASGEIRLARPAWLLLALLAGQITLGILVIWNLRPPLLTTFHVVNGAALLATTILIAVRAGHGARVDAPVEPGTSLPLREVTA
jgi:cytochrome c oxidase assembly protein subunit 15